MIFRKYRQTGNITSWVFISLFVCGVSLFSSRFFFNSDTIFYIARRIGSLADVANLLLHYDDRANFRPLTYGIASWLLVPIGGLHPWVYHLSAALIHCLNTYLAFLLARRLTGQKTMASLVAYFFGLHWVIFHATYGMVCLPDLSYVFFGLLSLLALCRCRESGPFPWLPLSLMAFLAALGCKETAVVIPFMGTAVAWHRIRPASSSGPLLPAMRQAIYDTRLHWLMALIYLGYFAYLGGGSLFPQDPTHPYAVSFSWRGILAKFSYLQWWTNLPAFYDTSQGPSPVMDRLAEIFPFLPKQGKTAYLLKLEIASRWAAVFLWIPVLAYLLYRTFRSAAVRSYFYVGLAFLASLGPVLFLSNKQMPHNLYLAVFGFALWAAAVLSLHTVSEHSVAFPKPGDGRGYRIEYTVFAFLLLTLTGVYQEAVRSWQTHGSMMARTAIEDLKTIAPRLSPAAGLYFLGDKDSGQRWDYDGGNLFRVVLRRPDLRIRFQGEGNPFPDSIGRNADLHILESRWGRLVDVTGRYLHPGEREGEDLTPLFDISTIAMNTREYYPDYQAFDTPNKKAAFFTSLHRARIERTAIVTIAGASVHAHVPPQPQPVDLLLRLCSLHTIGDGAHARLTAKTVQGEKILYQAEFRPLLRAEDDSWVEVRLDLSQYTGQAFDLRIESFNSPGNNAIGDWLGWSLVLVRKAT